MERKIILQFSAEIKKVHAVTEHTSDSESYEDVNCITEVNREDETVNQVKSQAWHVVDRRRTAHVINA